MLAISEHPETLEEVQETIQRWLEESPRQKIRLRFARDPKSDELLCFISYNRNLKLKMGEQWILFEMKNTSLKLILDKFFVSTAIEGEKVCLNIELAPQPEHRFLLDTLRRQIAETKHPAFQSRVLRAFLNLEKDLPNTTIEQATAAPTDLLVALEALSSAPGTSQLISDDPLLAARLRGIKRKKHMLDTAGGTLSSQEVAELLGISRQAVDKRRASNQLLALTQGKRGYSYPRFQFEEGNTIKGLEETLEGLKAVDPWMQMVFFTNPHERLEGKTPIECLQEGLVKEVLQAASGYGEQGAL